MRADTSDLTCAGLSLLPSSGKKNCTGRRSYGKEPAVFAIPECGSLLASLLAPKAPDSRSIKRSEGRLGNPFPKHRLQRMKTRDDKVA